MFYDNYLRLCNAKGVSPSKAAVETGGYKSDATRWKNGSVPTDARMVKLADYFGVPVSELGDEKEKSTGNADGLSEEEIKFIEWYRSQASEKEKALVRRIVEGEK